MLPPLLVTLLVFSFIVTGCDGFNSPLKFFIAESSRHGGGGEGTPEDPFRISDPTHLERIGVDPGWGLDMYYTLTSDIDLTEINWRPIASDNTPFTGSFNGNGHTINGLNIANPTADDSGNGLFAHIGSGGVVRNLGLTAVDIYAGNTSTNVGAIAGINNNGAILNSFVEGIGIVGGDNVGGIVGHNMGGGTIRNSYAALDVTGNSHVGGIVGQNSFGGITNTVALNPNVIANNLSAGRVAGSTGGGNLNMNHAIDTMDGSFSAGSGHTTLNGQDLAVAESRSASWWVNPFNWAGGSHWEDPDVWSLEDGRYPSLVIIWE